MYLRCLYVCVPVTYLGPSEGDEREAALLLKCRALRPRDRALALVHAHEEDVWPLETCRSKSAALLLYYSTPPLTPLTPLTPSPSAHLWSRGS